MKRQSLLESRFAALPAVQRVDISASAGLKGEVDILRLDQVHPFISGNKWYKLQHYLREALQSEKSHLLSFGGAYSNHLHALAYSAQQIDMPVTGIVRGEISASLTPTLQDCSKWGMRLEPMSRDRYRELSRESMREQVQRMFPDAYVIPEGGEGTLGTLGVHDLFARLYHEGLMSYDLIVSPVGSGTTLAGIISASKGRAQVLGISALKGAYDLEARVETALEAGQIGDWEIWHDYHFGGFAKQNPRLTDFISRLHASSGVLLDPVYTGKAFFALAEGLAQGRIAKDARVLFVHTGGLQGWRGLADSRPA